MNEEERRVIVDQEMVKALKFLTDAEELARLEMWNVVANRAYYALYHAVMAMMVNDGFSPKTHSGLITEFGREYVITGKIDPKYSKVLSQMRSIRENCDYDVFYYYCCPLKVSEQRDIHPQCCCNGIADDFSEGKPLS